jgi:hypothetical protein
MLIIDAAEACTTLECLIRPHSGQAVVLRRGQVGESVQVATCFDQFVKFLVGPLVWAELAEAN